jgi:hypothetical protein
LYCRTQPVLQQHSSADALKYPTEISAARQTAAAHPVQSTPPRIANSKMYISMGTDLATVSKLQDDIDVYGI